MKPNTSNNDEHELEKKRWKNVENSKAIPFIGIKDKLYCESIDVMMLVSVAKEQGYAKALKSQEFMDKINFAIRRTKEKTLNDVGKIIDKQTDAEKWYGQDVFGTLSKEDLKRIHFILKKEMNCPLDRLSAHYCRRMMNNWRELLVQKIQRLRK